MRRTGLVPKMTGNENTATKQKVNFFIDGQEEDNVGSEIGRKFGISKESHLQNFNFFLSYNNFDTVTFRINIYGLKGGKPEKNLLTKNIIESIYNKQTGWFRVDLSQSELTVNSDIIISLKWIDHSQHGDLLSMSFTFPSIGATHYYKFGSQNKWKTFFSMSSCMNVELLN